MSQSHSNLPPRHPREEGLASAASMGPQHSAAPGSAWLDGVAGPALAPIALPLDGELVLGRGDDCGGRLAHDSVSRQHLLIARSEKGWIARDLGSTHGTRFDGEPVAPNVNVIIRHGSTITIGPWVFRVRVGESDAPVKVSAPSRGDAMTHATRPTIFLRLRADDTRQRELSWQEFRDRYAPVIVGFARHAGLSKDEAEDVLQDVLLAFFRVSPRFEYDPDKGRFRGYLKRATLNVIRRRRRHAQPASLEHDPADEGVDDPHLASRWEEEWEAQLMERALADVKSHVDSRTWEAFELYVRREMPAEEVAKRLDVSVNSVHQAKSRVLRAARDAVERLRHDEG